MTATKRDPTSLDEGDVAHFEEASDELYRPPKKCPQCAAPGPLIVKYEYTSVARGDVAPTCLASCDWCDWWEWSRTAAWPDAFNDEETRAVRYIMPCRCCGVRCTSQLEGSTTNDGMPWPLCSGCDPALDDPDDDWVCECRLARGDANWELPAEGAFP